MLFLKYSKSIFVILVLILGIFLMYETFKNETKYRFNNQEPNKFIRHECAVWSCGGWGKK